MEDRLLKKYLAIWKAKRARSSKSTIPGGAKHDDSDGYTVHSINKPTASITAKQGTKKPTKLASRTASKSITSSSKTTAKAAERRRSKLVIVSNDQCSSLSLSEDEAEPQPSTSTAKSAPKPVTEKPEVQAKVQPFASREEAEAALMNDDLCEAVELDLTLHDGDDPDLDSDEAVLQPAAKKPDVQANHEAEEDVTTQSDLQRGVTESGIGEPSAFSPSQLEGAFEANPTSSQATQQPLESAQPRPLLNKANWDDSPSIFPYKKRPLPQSPSKDLLERGGLKKPKKVYSTCKRCGDFGHLLEDCTA